MQNSNNFHPFLDVKLDELIELVRDDNRTFEPVKIQILKKIVNEILAAHEVQLQAKWEQSQGRN